MSTTEHIPAWKRLGLKLKYAKDTVPVEDVQHVSHDIALEATKNHTHDKKKRRIDSQDSTPVAKRHKNHFEAATPTGIASAQDHTEPQQPTANDRFANSVYQGRSLHAITKTPQKIIFDDDSADSPAGRDVAGLESTLIRKKSVTFTPETKVEDGTSGQTFSKLWLSPTPAASQAQEIPAEAVKATKHIEPATPQDKTETGSKSKKKQNKSKQSAEPNSSDQRACVQYLEQFHTDKTNWKFNKSKQNDLIRHIWDTESIPPSSNDALIGYISGLQGAGPRQRILEGAVAILDPLIEKYKADLAPLDMDTAVGRRAAYEKAVQKQLDLMTAAGRSEADEELLKTMKSETEQAERAEALVRRALWQELRPGQGFPDDAPKVVSDEASTNITPAKTSKSKRKSRKSRTAASSSSESSSSSEDDSDSESSTD